MATEAALADANVDGRCFQKRLQGDAAGGGEALPKPVVDRLVREYQVCARDNPKMAVATVAIKTLTTLISQSQATTMMGLEKEIKEAAAALQRQNPSSISLKAGCELFLRYTTRTSAIENEDFNVTKARLIERGNQFADTSTRARSAIADAGSRFLTNGCTVLCHGFSRVIVDILSRARKQGAHFTVLLTEGRPGEAAVRMANELVPLGIETTIMLDSAAAYHMDRIDMIIVGAEAVVESGGIINCVGTYGIALCAKALAKPVYCAAESYKFARVFPLSQRDIPKEEVEWSIGPIVPAGTRFDSPAWDYTPPEFLSLLITDFGVLTPAAVSDELIQLYL